MITERMIEAAATEIRLQLGSIGAFISIITCQRITKDALEAAERAAVSEEPAGLAGTMPGTDGFTMAVFHAADVPVGTPLYTRPLPPPPEAPKGEE